ncbi:hypothetical protein M2432_000046 [Mycobacterium sp. OTB74]|nr:hypothetical protein [Mycobacterium sp. OTB74]
MSSVTNCTAWSGWLAIRHFGVCPGFCRSSSWKLRWRSSAPCPVVWWVSGEDHAEDTSARTRACARARDPGAGQCGTGEIAENMPEDLLVLAVGAGLTALTIDGVHFGELHCAVALGIGIDAENQLVLLVEGSTENATLVVCGDKSNWWPPTRCGPSRCLVTRTPTPMAGVTCGSPTACDDHDRLPDSSAEGLPDRPYRDEALAALGAKHRSRRVLHSGTLRTPACPTIPRKMGRQVKNRLVRISRAARPTRRAARAQRTGTRWPRLPQEAP